MVSPLQSIAANLQSSPNPGMQLGDMLMQRRQQEAGIQGQGLLNQARQQQIQAGEQDQSLGAARYLNQLGKQLLNTNESQWSQILQQNMPQLQKLGYTPEVLRGMTRAQVESVVQQTEPLMQDSLGQTGAERQRATSMQVIQGAIDPQTGQLKPESELTAEQRVAAMELGLIAKAGTRTKDERVAGDPDLTDRISQSQAKIRKSIKLAESQAKAEGETFTDYKRAQAALPNLKVVVGKLADLAPIATNTIGGKLFDTASKELGFGSTKGANARAKFIAVIDNQILPLLRQTFGAAFTVQEGERLRATLGDPDATPGQKIEQLNAFIEAKILELGTKEQELSLLRSEGEGQSAATQQPSESIDPALLEFMTPEEKALFNAP